MHTYIHTYIYTLHCIALHYMALQTYRHIPYKETGWHWIPPRCHQSTCFGCAKKLQLAGGTCPICRARAPGWSQVKPGEAMETEWFCHSKWIKMVDLYGFIFCNMMWCGYIDIYIYIYSFPYSKLIPQSLRARKSSTKSANCMETETAPTLALQTWRLAEHHAPSKKNKMGQYL